MLHVLNTRERNNAFAKFLGLFSLTILMVSIATFFSWRTPTQINNQLNEHLEKINFQKAEQQNFFTAIDSAQNLIDLLDKPGCNVPYTNELIAKQIANLKETTMKISNDNIYAEINKKVLTTFLHYTDATYQLTGLKEVNKQIESLKGELSVCQTKRREAERDAQLFSR